MEFALSSKKTKCDEHVLLWVIKNNNATAPTVHCVLAGLAAF